VRNQAQRVRAEVKEMSQRKRRQVKQETALLLVGCK